MSVFLPRIRIINYRSIANAELRLESKTFLVGPNGSGKSNIVDALSIISEGLQTTLEHAIRRRGGIKEVRRRTGGHPSHFSISLCVATEQGLRGVFAFRVGALEKGDFEIQEERSSIEYAGFARSYYEVERGELVRSSADVTVQSKIFPDRFFLTTLSALENFRQLFDLLSRISTYNISPNIVRASQPPDSGEILDREGHNISSVIRRLSQYQINSLERIKEYLRRIVPGIDSVSYASLGQQGTLEFRQIVQGARTPWRFYASNMSDGTLRSLGVLTALLQTHEIESRSPPLIAIEEPESTIHPGAAAVIMDAISEAARRKQIIVTTHSPDLLDHTDLHTSEVLNVVNEGGITFVYPIDEPAKNLLKERLLTPGDLLRANQLTSAAGKTEPLRAHQLALFPLDAAG
jgi:predicted ATPase